MNSFKSKISGCGSLSDPLFKRLVTLEFNPITVPPQDIDLNSCVDTSMRWSDVDWKVSIILTDLVNFLFYFFHNAYSLYILFGS